MCQPDGQNLLPHNPKEESQGFQSRRMQKTFLQLAQDWAMVLSFCLYAIGYVVGQKWNQTPLEKLCVLWTPSWKENRKNT